MPGYVCALPKPLTIFRKKGKNGLAHLLHIAGRDAVAPTKSRREVGGVLIARHPGRLLYAISFKQIASCPRQAAVAQVVEDRAAVCLAKLAAQAAGAHRRPPGRRASRFRPGIRSARDRTAEESAPPASAGGKRGQANSAVRTAARSAETPVSAR